MTGTPSEFVTARNAIEAFFTPSFQSALLFAAALKDGLEANAPADISAAFEAGISAFESAAGTFEAKTVIALGAIASTLLGEVYQLVKTTGAAQGSGA